MAESIIPPRAQEPLTRFLQPDDRSLGSRKFLRGLLGPWAKFVESEAVAALLRGAQPSDLEARVAQMKQRVRMHGALRGLTFELSGPQRQDAHGPE